MSSTDKETDQEDAVTSLSFTSILGLSLATIFVIIILIFVAINGLQQTASAIINTAEQGISFVTTAGANIVDQGKNVISSLAGSLQVSAENSYNTVINALNQIANSILSLGDALLQNLQKGFQTIIEFLSELGNQLIITFFSMMASIFIMLLGNLQIIKFTAQITYAVIQADISPIKIII